MNNKIFLFDNKKLKERYYLHLHNDKLDKSLKEYLSESHYYYNNKDNMIDLYLDEMIKLSELILKDKKNHYYDYDFEESSIEFEYYENNDILHLSSSILYDLDESEFIISYLINQMKYYNYSKDMNIRYIESIK